jgi:hypothetical protein
VAEQLALLADSSLTDDVHAILQRAHEREGIRPSHHAWYPGAPRVGSMPEHDAAWLGERVWALLESFPERAAAYRLERRIEERRRAHGYPLFVRGAGHALRWWTPEKRIVLDLRAMTRRRLTKLIDNESRYDRYGACERWRWGLAGALGRYTPHLVDRVWQDLPQRLRDAVMRSTKQLPDCVGELMHPVSIWWHQAPSHALRRLGLER